MFQNHFQQFPNIYFHLTRLSNNQFLVSLSFNTFKYACIIGTIFDLQTLDKLNPLFSIVKTKDLEKVMLKYDRQTFINVFENTYYPNKGHIGDYFFGIKGDNRNIFKCGTNHLNQEPILFSGINMIIESFKEEKKKLV